MMQSRRSYQMDLKVSEALLGSTMKNSECTYIGNKSIIQKLNTCTQCFPSGEHICLYCYENCHKKKQHTQCKTYNQYGSFICQCGIANHITTPEVPLPNCVYGPINAVLGNQNQICPQCQIAICEYCYEYEHKAHFNECNESNYSDESCQCKGSHFGSHYQQHIELILKKYAKTQCKSTSLPFQVENSLKNKYNMHYLKQLFDCILLDQDLFDAIFLKTKHILNDIGDLLEGGDQNLTCIWLQRQYDYYQIRAEYKDELSLNDKLRRLFSEQLFPYDMILGKYLFINKFLLQFKRNKYTHVNQKLFDCFPVNIFISDHINVLQKFVKEQTFIKISNIFIESLTLKLSYLKTLFRQFRVIDIYTIKNGNPFQRLRIARYNQLMDNKQIGVQVIQQIKQYKHILFELEPKNKIILHALIFNLKCLKLLLQTGLNINTKLVEKVLMKFYKLYKDIEYFNQQTKGEINDFFNEKMFNLLGKVLVLAYFNFKDKQWQHYVENYGEQCQNQNNSKHSFTKFINLIYSNKVKSGFLQHYLYNTSYGLFSSIYKVFIAIIIDSNLYGNYFKRKLCNQTKLNYLIQIILREQLQGNSTTLSQLQSVQTYDWILHYSKPSTSQTIKQSELNSLNLKLRSLLNQQNNDFQTLQKIRQVLDQILNLDQLQGLQNISDKFNTYISDKVYLKCNNNINKDFDQLSTLKLQNLMFEVGLDITLNQVTEFLLFNCQTNKTDIRYINSMKVIQQQMMSLIQLFCFNNVQHINIWLNAKQMDLNNQLGQLSNTHDVYIQCYHKIFVQSGLLQLNKSILIQPHRFIKHLYSIYVLLDSQYSDASEVSSLSIVQLNWNKYQLIDILNCLVAQLSLKQLADNDYQQDQDTIQFLLSQVLVDVSDHLIELFRQGNTSSLNESSYQNVFETKNQHNRYAKVTFHQAQEQIDTIWNELNNAQQQQMGYAAIATSNKQSQDLSLQELIETLTTKFSQVTLFSQIAASTLLLSHQFIKLISQLIELNNGYQLLQSQEIGEQVTISEKLEQVFVLINTNYKQYLVYKGPLDRVVEIRQQIDAFIQTYNYGNQGRLVDKQFLQIVQQDEQYSLLATYLANQLNQEVKQIGQDYYNIMTRIQYKIQKHTKQPILDVKGMEVNGLVQIIKKQYRNKTKDQCGNILFNLLMELLQQETNFNDQRNLEYPHCIFMHQANNMKLLLRLLQVETKASQLIIKQNIKSYPQFETQFKNCIQNMLTTLLPQLCSNVMQFDQQPYLIVVINSGKYAILILELIRFFAEGQNTFLQQYLGDQQVLSQILKLLGDLLKSKHIFEIVINIQSGQILDKKTLSIQQTFLQLYAHTIITIAEYNQGSCLQNQKLTFDYLSKHRIWSIIVQILTIKTYDKFQNNIYTLRLYIFYLILSLVEDPDKNSDDFQYIMNIINPKLLEDTLTQTYKSLILFNNLTTPNKTINLSQIQLQLTELYRQSLGDDINESLIFDSKILIKICYQIYTILNLYGTVNKEIAMYLQDYSKNKEQNTVGKVRSLKYEDEQLTKSAFKFIYSVVGSIEYLDQNGQLYNFHFLIPPMCFFLSAESKFLFLAETVDRSNSSSKIASILEVIPSFITEMEENMSKYRKSQFQQQLINVAISPNFHHKQFSLVITALNFIVLLLISNNHYIHMIPDDEDTISYLVSHQLVLYLSQIVLIMVTLLALVCQLFFRMSIYYKLYSKQLDVGIWSTLRILYRVFSRRDIFQFILHLFLSILGVFEPFFFYIESFCFIYISKTMYSVLEALKLRWVQFLGIFTMLLIILNAYSYIGFRRFTTSFQLEVITNQRLKIKEEELLCDTPVHCFMSLVYFGLREGTGLGTYGDAESYYQSQDYFSRFIYDFSFFIIVTLIMLNIINGIIIDTFADLRDQQQRNEYDTNNVCMICSLERWQFEKKGLSFEQHVNDVHNLWNYFSFIVHLNKIGKDNMNGIETHIYTKLNNRDMSWVPQESTKLLNS